MRKTGNIAFVLAGGSGLRLWPLSRNDQPKQFTRLFGGDSLIQSTVKRLSRLFGDQIFFLVGEEHKEQTRAHLEDIDFNYEGKIITEPLSRNTAPAIYLGLKKVSGLYENANVFVFPADHLIGDQTLFEEAVKAGGQCSSDGFIVIFGIKPDHPETGYGYIEYGATIEGNSRYVKSFIEKPDAPTAAEMENSGRYYWNSGMFAFDASLMLQEYRKHCPEIPELFERYKAYDDKNIQEIYKKLPHISLDNAIIEKTDICCVLEYDFGWSDIGSWKSVYDHSKKDDSGNVTDGNILFNDSEGCYVKGDKKLIVINDIKDIAVIDTGDALLVSSLKNASDIKTIINRHKIQTNRSQGSNREYFQWGFTEVLDSSVKYLISRKVLYSGLSMILQNDGPNDIRWIVAGGIGRHKSGDFERSLSTGDSVLINTNMSHTLINTGDINLEVIELKFY